MSPEERRLRERIKILERRLSQIEQANLSFEEIRSKIMGLPSEPKPPPKEWTAPPAKHRRGIAGIPTLVISDIHYGETVDKGEAYGNKFNRQIARRRLGRVIWGALDLIRHHMVGEPPSTVVVPLLGDIVTGEIHDELAKTNDGELLPALPEAVDLLFTAVTTIAEQTGANVVVPCAAGNHGRNTKRVEAKRFTATNFDWLIYVLLERQIANSKWAGKIVVTADPSNEARWKVYDHSYLGLHGHDLGVKGGDGIIGAIGPIMRGRMKVLAQQRAVGYGVDTLVLGHWHQYLTLPGLVVNGSIKGYDEFAARVLRAPPAPPIQALWYTHPDRGITCHWPVFAE